MCGGMPDRRTAPSSTALVCAGSPTSGPPRSWPAILDDLFPGRAALKGPRLISFDLDKFFVSQVDEHFDDIVNIRREWPFDAMVCDGAFYAEQLVAESLHVPVYAIGLSMVMPDGQGPPPFFGLRPARTPSAGFTTPWSAGCSRAP